MTEFDDALPPEVMAALERGHKIEAIKLLRELKGVGLKEAKDAVDRYKPGRSSMAADSVVRPGSNGYSPLLWLVLLGLLGLAVAWFGGWL
nr:ribosomal protein L7/L12 [uncultured Pseudomonas sp.]